MTRALITERIMAAQRTADRNTGHCDCHIVIHFTARHAAAAGLAEYASLKYNAIDIGFVAEPLSPAQMM